MKRIERNRCSVVGIVAGAMMTFAFIMPVTATADNISLNVKDPTTGSDKFVVMDTGSVGIGTASPQAQLHVTNNALIGDPQAPATPILSFTSNVVGKGTTTHSIFNFAGNYGDTGALHIGAGMSANNGNPVRNNIVLYNYACLGGTCNIPTLFLMADQTIATGTFTSDSDRRLKKDITDMTDALQKIKSLRAVRYKWENTQMPQDAQIGVLAQEVEQVLPELVHEHDNPLYLNDKTKGYIPKIKSVDYIKLSVVALQALKDLAAKVEDMESKLKKQDDIDARLQKLEKLAGN